jgi:hypothetical protein
MNRQWNSRFSLAGIRAATTAPQEALLALATEVLRRDRRVLAAWLVGSFAGGIADPFSDIDVHCCVGDGAIDELRGDGWKEVLHEITPTVMATTFPFPGTVGGFALTPEWTHIDLAFHARAGLELNPEGGLRPLFDRTGGLLPREPVPPAPVQREPYFPADAVDLYFYIFGNLVTVVGRNEPILLNNGVVLLRDSCLVPLLCAERGVHRIGGAKRMRRFLSRGQYELLCSLPAIDGTLDTCIEANLALARIFVPRARALAGRVGASWPADLERATIDHVERGLGIRVDIPTGPR